MNEESLRNVYSRLSLSRPRLSRSENLLKHENLTTGNKILWKKRRNCSYEAMSPLFHNIFKTSLTSGVKLHINLWNVVVRLIFSSIPQIWHIEVQISRSISASPLDFEKTRVDCKYSSQKISYCFTSRLGIISDSSSWHGLSCLATLILQIWLPRDCAWQILVVKLIKP